MNYRNGDFPSDYEAKQAILEVGRRMYMKNFVAANDGNISCKVSEDTIYSHLLSISMNFSQLPIRSGVTVNSPPPMSRQTSFP